MRQTPWRRDQNTALLLTVLTVCALLLMLAPGIGATSARETTDMIHGQMSGREAGRVESDLNRGIVTDDDGFIGNGTHGADAPQRGGMFPAPDGAMPDGATPRSTVPDATTPDDIAPHGADGTARDGGVAGNNAPMDGATAGDNTAGGNTAGDSTDTATGNASGVLGWIIAIIVIVAIALVVLALIPKRDPSRK